MTRSSVALLLASLTLALPALAEEEPPVPVIEEDMERLGWGAFMTLDFPLSHGFGAGSTVHLELHRGDNALQLSIIGARHFSFMLDDDPSDLRWVAGGTLLATTLGLRRVLTRSNPMLQPWLSVGLGHGWFWFSDSQVKQGSLGIDSDRLAWFLEAGLDYLNLGRTMTFSLRVLSSPVGLMFTPALNMLFTQ